MSISSASNVDPAFFGKKSEQTVARRLCLRDLICKFGVAGTMVRMDHFFDGYKVKGFDGTQKMMLQYCIATLQLGGQVASKIKYF